MKIKPLPPPLIQGVDGASLGPPPRSMFVACMMADFGMTEAEAGETVDRLIAEMDLDVRDDRDQRGPVTLGRA